MVEIHFSKNLQTLKSMYEREKGQNKRKEKKKGTTNMIWTSNLKQERWKFCRN